MSFLVGYVLLFLAWNNIVSCFWGWLFWLVVFKVGCFLAPYLELLNL